jgi:hypothetical protein
MDTLEMSGLDPKTTLILGGSALALAGIRPAHDVDTMVPGAAYNELRRLMKTPSGLLLRHRPSATRDYLDPYPNSAQPTVHLPMSIDITHPHYEGNVWHPKHDEAFLDQLEAFDDVGGYRFMPPELVARDKAIIGRRKDRADIRLIQQHLDSKK